MLPRHALPTPTVDRRLYKTVMKCMNKEYGMFGFLKSGMDKMRTKMFNDDFSVLRDHMAVEDQLKVYRLMRDDYY